MEIIRGAHNIHPKHSGCVLAVGNFDGMHLGHQALLKALCEKARQLSLPGTLIVFEPQPLEYFDAERAPPRLTRFREKVALARQTGLDRLLFMPFNACLSNQSADEVIRQLLVEKLGVRYVLVGDDFRFGAGRSGSLSTLQSAGTAYGFEAEGMASVKLEGERVSSSLIRAFLVAGDIARAERFLGHPYQLMGHVTHGRKLGRTLDIPTANILFGRYNPPLQGVFAVAVAVQGSGPLLGVANIGVRPAVSGKRPQLEVHLIDFSGDLYGRLMRVRILRQIREERHFDSLELLRAQIMEDIKTVRDWHSQDQLTLSRQAPFSTALY